MTTIQELIVEELRKWLQEINTQFRFQELEKQRLEEELKKTNEAVSRNAQLLTTITTDSNQFENAILNVLQYRQ